MSEQSTIDSLNEAAASVTIPGLKIQFYKDGSETVCRVEHKGEVQEIVIEQFQFEIIESGLRAGATQDVIIKGLKKLSGKSLEQ